MAPGPLQRQRRCATRPRALPLPLIARSFVPVRFATLLTSVGVLLTQAACGGGGDDILIGLAAPLSEARGQAMLRGAELAVSEINQAGGVRGRNLALVAADDSARPDAAVRVAQRFVGRRGLVAVVGHLTSAATNVAAPVYNGADRPLVHISPSASSPTLSNAGPFSFRVCPDDQVHGQRLARWAWETVRARWVAILYENDDYGRGVRTAFSESFTALGGYIATEDPYGPRLPTFEPFLGRLQAAGGADALLIAGSAGSVPRILATMDSMAISVPILGADGLSGLESATGVSAEGLFVSSAYLPDRSNPRNEAFVSAYRASFADRAPDHRAAGAYDAVHLLAEAIRAVGTDRARAREYLADVGSTVPAFQGVTGSIAFDQNGDVTRRQIWIGVVRAGRLTTAPGQ